MSTGDAEGTTVDIGQAVFDEAGNELGSVRGVTENGFVVATGEGIEALSIAHERAGEAGTAELMWRCGDCGEMGDIENLPDSCPGCGAAAEAIYYYVDD
ncbi:MAG: rubredoxin-like domain-containing protein [Halobacteriales archaeon]